MRAVWRRRSNVDFSARSKNSKDSCVGAAVGSVHGATEGAYIVTAGHVVEGVKHPHVAPAANPNVWSRARTLRLDPDGDLAVLLVDSARANEHYSKIPLAADVPGPDQEVTVIGFPRSVGGLSILPGRVTPKGQNLVFSQRLEEGFSGSPMLFDGRIAGVVTRSTPQRGVGVTVNAVRNFLRGAGIQNQRIDVYRPYGSDDYRIETRIALDGRAPRGLATDEQRQVYVTDIAGNSVSRYDGGGRLTKRWGRSGQGPGEFNDPWGIAVDRYRDRRVYVADSGNHRVQAFTPDGRFLTSWGGRGKGDGQFDWPIDIAVDREHGYVYVLDSRNARVQVFEPDGTFLGQFGTHGAEPGEFLEPYGIALDDDRHCYVLDTGNFRIQMFSIAWQ
jgi:sugar lactone lactonase YvrE